METKTVEFDNGTEVTVTDEGEVEEVTKLDEYGRFFKKLGDAGFEVDHCYPKSGFVGGSGGDGIIMSDKGAETTIFSIIEESDVTVKSMWPSYEDESDLALFISLR